MATNRQDNVQCQEISMENKEKKCHPMKGPIFCEPCQYDESFEEVTGFCVTCSEYLCQTCCRDHKRNKVTRRHSLLKYAEIPTYRRLRQLSNYRPAIFIPTMTSHTNAGTMKPWFAFSV
ncbi:hypothetical protein MAR_020870 [Mya arenaria]|uniref:B box-type domain-containing protein n=1 Tax=Mya arenaria TaxID=6604 RepID=A0ABY7EEB1_MYAAR|nr:hypothetical protein MAR_020870 [Mya arenaria]